MSPLRDRKQLRDAGMRKATVRQYQAQYNEAVAGYRQTSLTAFQQVEDNLAALRILNQDVQEQAAAVQSARRYLSQATVRNTAGLEPFLNVLTAQMNLLTYQQTYVTFRTQQMVASVQLIEALGWRMELLTTSLSEADLRESFQPFYPTLEIEKLFPQADLIGLLCGLRFVPSVFLAETGVLPFIDLDHIMIHRRQCFLPPDGSNPLVHGRFVTELHLVKFRDINRHFAHTSSCTLAKAM
jgi:Outer membrane efflux protein